MYRQESWAKGFYQDNLEKYECCRCGWTFIVGREMLHRSGRELPICPYCGGCNKTEWISGTEDDQLEELQMGCAGLYIDGLEERED